MIEDVKAARDLSPQKSSPESLKNNFKNLSSGFKVAAGAEALSRAGVPRRNGSGFTKMIRDLNDAVSFSTLALKSLEKVSEASENGGDKARVVEAFVQDLEKLRSDIGDALESLRQRAETAEVMRENIMSAESSLQHVDGAQAHAEQTGTQIHQDIETAVSAHGDGLTPDRVQELLSE